MLKLCEEAGPRMTEATKLENLLNKTKRSIQLEVHKKKPTFLTEYLEFAKEDEELIQVSTDLPSVESFLFIGYNSTVESVTESSTE